MKATQRSMKVDISVLLPTRGRTHCLRRSVLSLIDLARDPHSVELLFGMDRDDEATIQWCIEYLLPELEKIGIVYTVIQFEPMGYIRLNDYVNYLAGQATGSWLMFWNDDAVMNTEAWDDRIRDHDGQFRVLRMPTHNQHPYAIFPIIPRAWYELLGNVSEHQLNDAWISQIAYLLDIMQDIAVKVTHDRKDLTGNNDDDTFRGRIMLEGNPKDPRDFNHISNRDRRMAQALQICEMLEREGRDMPWFRAVIAGKQDPWERMVSPQCDPNRQLQLFK